MKYSDKCGISTRYTTKVDSETGQPIGEPQFVSWSLVPQQNLLDKNCRLGNVTTNLLDDIYFPPCGAHQEKKVSIENLMGMDVMEWARDCDICNYCINLTMMNVAESKCTECFILATESDDENQ